MSEEMDKSEDAGQAVEVVERTMERLFGGANVKNVYGRPVQHGDTTIIPAAEVFVAGGFATVKRKGSPPVQRRSEGELGKIRRGGGGGGGTTQARPVAVIIASPEGVRVEPVIDIVKIGLAVVSVWGAILAQRFKMLRSRK